MQCFGGSCYLHDNLKSPPLLGRKEIRLIILSSCTCFTDLRTARAAQTAWVPGFANLYNRCRYFCLVEYGDVGFPLPTVDKLSLVNPQVTSGSVSQLCTLFCRYHIYIGCKTYYSPPYLSFPSNFLLISKDTSQPKPTQTQFKS